jgi:hypothetical protein
MYPSFPLPFRKRLAGCDTEAVQGVIARSACKLGTLEPACWELITAIGHVLATEHPEAKHFGWRKIRFELRIEIAANRLDELVAVISLHPIVDCDRPLHIPAQELVHPRI